jgi:hypothetical protein
MNNILQAPIVQAGYGIRTPYATLLPPGGRIAAFVRSSGDQGDDPVISSNLVQTLAQGLRRCRPNRGDTVVVLEGHSESVTDATMLGDLVPGTRIVGVGLGAGMPTFRWTATAAQWAVSQADVHISGLRLRLEGANGVVKAIAVTGADFTLQGCDVELASGATAKATIGLELGAGAHRATIVDNRIRGTAGHNVTDGILVAAAVDDTYIARNKVIAAATSANGLIRFSAAALRALIEDNVIFNTMTTAANVAIALGSAATTGVARNNHLGLLTAGSMTSGTHGISFSGDAHWRFFNNLMSDSANATGAVIISAAS